MTNRNTENETLPTIWHVPDDLWEMVSCLLERFDPPKKTGRKRIDPRRALDGMIYRMRTGCQWNQLPEQFGDDASIHRTQQRWERLQLFDALWGMIAARCQDLAEVDGEWQSADGCLGKARGVPKKGGSTHASAPTLRIGRSRVSRKVFSLTHEYFLGGEAGCCIDHHRPVHGPFARLNLFTDYNNLYWCCRGCNENRGVGPTCL